MKKHKPSRYWLILGGVLVIFAVTFVWQFISSGCIVFAGCGAGSQYCASNCCLGSTVIDVVSGCDMRSWGCAAIWDRQSVGCNGGCEAFYDQGACQASYVRQEIWQWVSCWIEEECSWVWQWEYVCEWEQVCYDQLVCYGNYYCWYERVCESVQVCHQERVRVRECTPGHWSTCYVLWGHQDVLTGCQRVGNSARTNCCGSGPPPTPTRAPVNRTPGPNPTNIAATPTPVTATQTPIWTPTHIPTASATPVPGTPTGTPTQTPEPLMVDLQADYIALLYMAPALEQPTQILRGSVSGGTPPYQVYIRIEKPDGTSTTYDLGDNNPFILNANRANAEYFGVDVDGQWTAWANTVDSTGWTAQSVPVTWYVSWYPVHGLP